MGRLGRGDDLLIGGLQPAVADILHDGAGKEPRVLQHHAKGVAQLGALNVAQVHAVHADAALVHIVEAQQQLDHGGLAGAGLAHQGNGLAGVHMAGEVADDGLVAVVSEGDVVKIHLAMHIRQADQLLPLLLLPFIQKGEHALAGRGHRLQLPGELGKLGDGLAEVAHIGDKGLNVAHADAPHGRLDGAHDGHRHVAQIAHKVHDGHHQPAEELALPRAVELLVVDFGEIPLGLLLVAEGLDDHLARVTLLHQAVELAHGLLLALEVFASPGHHKGHDDAAEGHDAQHQQRHQGADGQHHGQHTQQSSQAGDGLRHGLRQVLPNGIHIVGHQADDIAHLAGFEVFERHAVYLVRDGVGRAVVEIHRHVHHHAALHPLEQRAEYIDAQHAQQYLAHPAKVDAALALHLAHQALEDFRRGLAQYLGADDAAGGGQYGQPRGQQQLGAVGLQPGQQTLEGGLEAALFAVGRCHAVHQATPPFSSSALSWLCAISR